MFHQVCASSMLSRPTCRVLALYICAAGRVSSATRLLPQHITLTGKEEEDAPLEPAQHRQEDLTDQERSCEVDACIQGCASGASGQGLHLSGHQPAKGAPVCLFGMCGVCMCAESGCGVRGSSSSVFRAINCVVEQVGVRQIDTTPLSTDQATHHDQAKPAT